MESNDKYVHGMDWGKDEICFKNFKNYRSYQYDLIKNYVGNNILEVGTGDRSFTKQIVDNKEHLERLFSIEPSEVLFKMHENNYIFKKNVFFNCVDVFDLDPLNTGYFDTSILIHVLEHIEFDNLALNKISEFIKPGGHVLIEVPALPCLYSVHDEILGHYRRYNKRILKSIVDKDKYEIVKIWYQDPIGVIGSYLFFKMLKVKIKSDKGISLAKNQGGIYDKFIIPFEKAIEKFIKFPFGLSLTIILKKI